MILILAEKPSAKRNFAKALDGTSGTYGGSQYKICALRGHVMGLLPPDKQVPAEQSEAMQKWSLEGLPWDLGQFAWKKGVLKGCSDVISELKRELAGVDEVCIATDVDPSGEGELLAWEALEKCGWHGKTSRMYFTDEAPASVQKAFKGRKMLGAMEEDGDFVKAHVRERWDLASMQFVRAATCIARDHGFHTVVREGRLKSVMVKLTGDQLEVYNGYVKKPFFEARFRDENGNVFARTYEDGDEWRFDSAEKVDLAALHESAVVEDSRAKKHTAPGKLLDLAGLSGILARRGHKPADVLACYQKMYEDQVVSYPRTEDKQITPEQFNELLPLVDRICAVVGVDPDICSHRTARKTHVKEGGAHGANRPGPNVPAALAALDAYGKCARDIYVVLAKNYLSMLAEDYEYELVKAHVADFPEFTGSTQIPLSRGFKAIFDSDASQEEAQEGAEKENTAEFGKTATPFCFEGANKRPQKPTMKWLTKRLEKYNVGTGATRTSTLAEITKDEDRALMREKKGTLSLTDCGAVSYKLLGGCQIASPEATERLFNQMEAVGRFELDANDVVNFVTDMVVHDIEVMKKNGEKLDSLGPVGSKVVGKCPRCGADVIDRGSKAKTCSCSSNKGKRDADGKWVQTEGCGFEIWKSVAGKKLTAAQLGKLLEGGTTGKISGFKSKTGKEFSAKLRLAADKSGKIEFVFDEKGKRK